MEWISETKKGRKPIKCVLSRKLLLCNWIPSLRVILGDRIIPADRQGHWGIYLPTPHPSLFEGWIQGFWHVLHMSPVSSRRQKKALQQRAAGKQWVAWILNDCQRTWAGKWQFLLQLLFLLQSPCFSLCSSVTFIVPSAWDILLPNYLYLASLTCSLHRYAFRDHDCQSCPAPKSLTIPWPIENVLSWKSHIPGGPTYFCLHCTRHSWWSSNAF